MRKDIHNSDIPELCRSCEARHRGICGALTADQLKALSIDATRREVGVGTELIAAEEPISNYASIMSGVVKLSKLLADGRRQIVGLQFAPDFLGRPFKEAGQINAEAATKVKLCSFPKRTIDRLLQESPALEHKLLEQTLTELDEARNWMLTLGRKNAEEKVASFLLLVAKCYDPETVCSESAEGSATFELPMTRADIADFLGLTIETTSRQLTRLKQENVIEIKHNRKITIPDMEVLRERSGD